MSGLVAVVDWTGDQAAAPLARRLLAFGSAETSDPAKILDLADVALGARGSRVTGQLHHHVEAGVAIVAAARIDNRDELTGELGTAPSIAELLLRAYERWGHDFAERLAGDFALVVWDARRRTVLAARDPFGVTPLAYRVTRGNLALASFSEQFLALDDTPQEPDDQAVFDYLRWDYRSKERTFFRDVRWLPGGHRLLATPNGVQLTRYFGPPDEDPRLVSPQDVFQEFRRRFSRSVADRLVSDRPVVVHLSGGVDSSSIACVADGVRKEQRPETPRLLAVSARYPGLACDEGEYIRQVAERIGFPVEEWDATQPCLLDLEQPALAGPGARTGGGGGSPGDKLIAVREGARVIVSGTGGDQLGDFPGVMRDLGERREWRAIASSILSPGLAWEVRARRMGNALRGVAPSLSRGAIGRITSDELDPAPPWLNEPGPWFVGGGDRARDDVSFVSHSQSVVWGHLTSPRMAAVLNGAQSVAAGYGLEIRYPFLDTRLAQLVLALPPAFRLAHRYWRLQQEALVDVLPPAVAVRRTKAFFDTAAASGSRAAAKRLTAIVSSQTWVSDRYVKQSEARTMLDRLVQGGGTAWGDWQAIWRIANVEVWMRRMLGYIPAPESGPSGDKKK